MATLISNSLRLLTVLFLLNSCQSNDNLEIKPNEKENIEQINSFQSDFSKNNWEYKLQVSSGLKKGQIWQLSKSKLSIESEGQFYSFETKKANFNEKEALIKSPKIIGQYQNNQKITRFEFLENEINSKNEELNFKELLISNKNFKTECKNGYLKINSNQIQCQKVFSKF